jgi:hypothetical protein
MANRRLVVSSRKVYVESAHEQQPEIAANISLTSVIVGRKTGAVSQHRLTVPQKASSCVSVKHILEIERAPRDGLTPRMMSIVTARSFDRWGYGSSPVAT